MYFVLVAITLFIYRSLLLNPTTHLLDWNDYPLYVWIMMQNVGHLKSLDLRNFFNGGIFYPLKGSLLFSDLFVPQSFIALPISFFTSNPVLVFNIVFFITLLLNIIAVAFFWKNFTQSKLLLLFVSALTLFSALSFHFRVHFQMLTIWPFFFGLAYLFKKGTYRNYVWLAVWTIIQFYSGIYYGIFMIVIIALYQVIDFIGQFKNRQINFSLMQKNSLLISLLILFVGPLFLFYYHNRQTYQATRDYGEYILYSAQLTDYLFPPHLSSLIGKIKLAQQWMNFTNQAGIFPGFVTLLFATMGIFRLTKIKKTPHVSIKLTKINLFFLSLMIIGLIFSLGPRLTANGQYLSIPLPYHFLLHNPFLEAIRVTQRWSVLFFLGLTYFALQGMKKIRQYSRWYPLILLFALILFLLELVPLKLPTQYQAYYPSIYQKIEPLCQTKSILLEYPMTQLKDGASIVTNLSYRTQMMLAAVNHHCTLVNGYTGFIPQSYSAFENQLSAALEKESKQDFFFSIKERGINYIKLNKNELFPDRVRTLESWFVDSSNFNVIDNQTQFLVVEVL